MPTPGHVTSPRYPTLSPKPIVSWGPGSARGHHDSTWLPTDAALQLQGPFQGDYTDTVATLAIYSHDDRRKRLENLAVSIELTKGDCIELAAALNRMADR